jgi:prepilin-type N-terminal cleavage/methylation domain-containing protein
VRAQRTSPRAFTLIELMVVIGIIAALLIVVVPAVNSLSKSGGRKAAIASLLGIIEQARAEAIKSGQATYVVFPEFATASQPTRERYHFKSFALFEDDPVNATTPRQLTGWKTLASGVSLRADSSSTEAITNLPDAATLTPSATITFTPENTATATFHCLKFNPTGELEAPTSNVKLAVFEGNVSGTSEVPTSGRDASGSPAARESIKIAHLTGRAEINQ